MEPVLKINALQGGYGEVDILRGIDISVAPRSIVTIAGTNGAGKSTIIKAVMGLLPRVSGTVTFEGRDVLRESVESRLDLGVAYVPQVANVFASLSVMENLQVVQGVKNRKERIARMLDMFPALAKHRKNHAGLLSGGERQQLAFARALMREPRIMLLDEPSAALSPSLVQEIFSYVHRLPETGSAVLMVEQRARQSLAISSYGYIIDQGKVAMEGQAQALLDDPRAGDLFLGKH